VSYSLVQYFSDTAVFYTDATTVLGIVRFGETQVILYITLSGMVAYLHLEGTWFKSLLELYLTHLDFRGFP
jgi:hypothetical protein